VSIGAACIEPWIDARTEGEGMKISTAVLAGLFLNVGVGGGVFAAQFGNPVASRRNGSAGNQWQAQRIVRQAYRDILGREPDPSGLQQYTRSMMYDGWSEADVRRSLQSSAEYAQRSQGYGQYGRNGQYGRYRQNGQYGQSGQYGQYGQRGAWGRSGVGGGQAADIVRQAYLSVLGREPDAVGMRDYTTRVLRDGWTERDVVRALRSSDEYRSRGR
jgi:hypothetical protein